MKRKYYISSSPHITDSDSIPKIMYSVIGALVPAGIASVHFFGWQEFWVIITAAITALLGIDLSNIDAIAEATPLSVFESARDILLHKSQFSEKVPDAMQALSQLYSSYSNLFIGKIGGCIGETSALLLLIGGFYLMYRRIIGWKIPTTFIFTVGLLTWIFGGTNGLFTGDPIFHILSGGVILGAFFMATDMVTTPITFKGRLIFGTGCGILTSVIRLWGGYPEGVSYSILLMNLTTPLLDRYTKPKKFGGK